MGDKINILVIPSDRTGCGFYRSLTPHVKLSELYGDLFNVEINYEPDFNNLDSFGKYDILHFHKGAFIDREGFSNLLTYCKEKGIVTVMDIDDHWNLSPKHPNYKNNVREKIPQVICENIRRADWVTTTTDIFAEEISKIKGNQNIFVFPNAIDPTDAQYAAKKNPSERLRFGFVMGSSHRGDMEQMNGLANMLKTAGLLDEIQLVLCGYDLRGTTTILDMKGNKIGERPIQPKESVWYEYEKILTDNYRIVSPDYSGFLQKYFPNLQYPNVSNEPYRREWTKNITEYAKHYQNIDVLLVPLECTPFNKVKSELKFIEAGFTRTAVIATDFGPYTIGSKSLLGANGTIDETGNCILIDDSKKHKAWFKAIKKLVENPELITLLQDNMYNTVKDKYDIRNVTKMRARFYQEILSGEEKFDMQKLVTL